MVLRGLGEKVYDSFFFNSNNMPFFLFAFTILYIEGQVIMITGAGTLTGIFADRNQINLINNFLIILLTVIFYWWYAEHSLERKGYITRKRYYPEDVAQVLRDYNEYLVDKRFIDRNKVGIEELQNFLVTKNIKIHEEKPIDTESESRTEENQE
jgi:hypothetical protein